MPVKPDLSGLDLDTLLALQNDVQSRIEALREEEAELVRADIVRAADRLGLSPAQLCRGLANVASRRRRKPAPDSAE